MATGGTTTTNIKSLMRKLQNLLKKTKYIGEFNVENISIGKSEAYVPIYYHIFYKFSQIISTRVSHHHVKLLARNDAKFIQGVLRLLKDVFNFVPQLTKEQFLQTGFSELKITTCIEVVQLLYNIHTSESGQVASAGSGRSMREPSKAGRSNFPQRQSLPASFNAPLLDKDKKQRLQKLVPKPETVQEEPIDHSTPKENEQAEADEARYWQLSGASSQSSINLAGNYMGATSENEHGYVLGDLNSLKKQIADIKVKLDELANYVYSPVHVLPVSRSKSASPTDDEQFQVLKIIVQIMLDALYTEDPEIV